jgi:hypothetical protein
MCGCRHLLHTYMYSPHIRPQTAQSHKASYTYPPTAHTRSKRQVCFWTDITHTHRSLLSSTSQLANAGTTCIDMHTHRDIHSNRAASREPDRWTGSPTANTQTHKHSRRGYPVEEDGSSAMHIPIKLGTKRVTPAPAQPVDTAGCACFSSAPCSFFVKNVCTSL